MIRLSLLAVVLLSVPTAFAQTVRLHATSATPVDPTSAILNSTEANFSQWIDHRHPGTGTFQQRYFMNSTYADGPSSPVIFLICGEYSCEKNDLITSLQFGGVDEYVREFHAHLVILEHRYYGKSQPFADLSTEHLKYLRTYQAIEDMADFHRLIESKYGITGKWISVGGSYAGVLSAYFRLKHPEAVAGALSSSGPVRAKVDFWEYDRHMTEALPADCSAKARELVDYFEGALSDSARMQSLRQTYQMPASATDLEVLDTIEGTVDGAVQYGSKNDFCKAILGAGGASTQEGSLAGWLKIAKQQGAYGPSAVTDLSDIHDFTDGARQWTYQTCVEYGYFQTADRDLSESLMPRRNDLDYQLEPCRKYFGRTSLPHTDRLNQHYYDELLLPGTTHILFTNAQDDPWSELSFTPSNSVGLLHTGLEVFEYDTLAHHGDLKSTTATTPQSVLAAKNLFRRLAKKWLQEN